jgi:hypothetical protein
MEESPSWEPKSHSVKKFPAFMESKIHYTFHKGLEVRTSV